MARIDVGLHRGDDGDVIEVSGELDLASAELLRRRLREAQRGGRDVELDFSRVTFMDSQGIHILTEVIDEARRTGRRVRIRRKLAPQVQRVFVLLRLDSLLHGA